MKLATFLKIILLYYLINYIYHFDLTTDIPIQYVSEERVKKRLNQDMINLKDYDLILKNFFIKEHDANVLNSFRFRNN